MEDQDPQDGHEGAAERAEPRASEAAKAFIKPYVLDGWTEAELSRKQPTTSRKEFAARVGGGKMTDHRGKERKISREKIAVTRVGHIPCFVLFDLTEIMAEIQGEEQQDESHRTLIAVFAEQERVAQARHEDEQLQQELSPSPHKHPAVFRSYNGGFCGHCGEPLGYIEVDGGRSRLYCNDKCRVAAYRKRKREESREQILQYNSELREYWQEHGIHGEVLLRLQEILFRHGKAVSLAATQVVLVALEAQAQAGMVEQAKLIEEVMLGGERLSFEEVRLAEFRIPAGVDGWLAFVNHTTIIMLRRLHLYISDREHHEYLKASRASRLEASAATSETHT